MNRCVVFISLIFVVCSRAIAEDNPFAAVRDRDQWAIEQVMAHKNPDDSWNDSKHSQTVRGKKLKVVAAVVPFKAQTYAFGTETDQAKVNVRVTDFGNSFLLDVTSDQAIQGWLLKRQSTREAFLKGGASRDNPYECRIRVDRPYLKDFGLTLYVTEDSDPAFIQLY